MSGEGKIQLTMDQLVEMVRGQVKASIDEMGIGKLEHKYGFWPSAEDIRKPGDPLSPDERKKISNFFRGMFSPDARFMEVPGLGGPFWRDLEVATDTAGGFLVPDEFRALVIQELEKAPVIRNLVTVFPISVKEELPKVTAKPVASWGAEGIDISQSDPTFGNLLLSTNQLSVFTPMSRKLASNARIDIVGLITTLFAEAFGKAEDAAFIDGDGTGKPLGIRNSSPAVTSIAQAAANLVADDLISLFYLVPIQYRRDATWVIHNTIIELVRKLKDLDGRYLWTDGLGAAPNTILGRPVIESNDIPITLGAGADSEIWLGNWRHYFVGDNETMSVESTTVGGDAFRKHQLWIKAWEEIDGRVALQEAFRFLSGVK